MSTQYSDLLLLTLPEHKTDELPKQIRHEVFPLEETNFLKRASQFSSWVEGQLEKQYNLQIGQFRDIWGGLPIIKRKHIYSIFEVNGLPSIELPNRFPKLSRFTLEKIRQLEDVCLTESDKILCPSKTICEHLESRGIEKDKITVIPNGADLPERIEKPSGLPELYIVYFGALQPWQGIDTLIKSLKYLKDYQKLNLIICSSHKEKLAKPYKKLASQLGVSDQIIWKHQLTKEELFYILQHAICSIAPLTECSRNVEQGCSPLKLFESMACQTPVIASDLPVVREILTPNTEVKLFRPGRPADLARCIRLLLDYPDFRQELAQNAYLKLCKQYTWESVEKKHQDFYKDLLTFSF